MKDVTYQSGPMRRNVVTDLISYLYPPVLSIDNGLTLLIMSTDEVIVSLYWIGVSNGDER